MSQPLSPPATDWVAIHRRAHPHTPGVIDAESCHTLSYADLHETVETLAARLAATGLGPGDHLGLAVPRSVPVALTALAAQRLGSVLVPIDPALPDERITETVDRFDVGYLIHDGKPDAAPSGVASTAIDVTAAVPGIGDPTDRPAPRHEWSPTDPMAMLTTSGTTGEPKGVVLSARNVWASAIASGLRLGIERGDRWVCCLPSHHMGGLAPIYRSAAYGTTAVIDPGPGFDVDRLRTVLGRWDATAISLVPTMLRRMLDTSVRELASLRFALVGGGPIPPALISRARAADVPACPTYGMTETASQVATAAPAGEAPPDTVGRPVPFTTISIENSAGEAVQDGEMGEVVVEGPTVMRGYYGDTEEIDDGMGTDGARFRTGDLGRVTGEGYLEVLGRKDDRILTGGETVDPTVVAETIGAMAAIEAAAVVGIPDPEWGELVAAVVVPTETGQVTAAEVRSHCRRHGPPAEVPKVIEFVDSIPRTVSGTVDRTALAAMIDPDGAGDADDGDTD